MNHVGNTQRGKHDVTKLLLAWLMREHKDVSDPASRMRVGQGASIVGIACNAILCFAKGCIGLLVGSVSITADALNNLSDAASNIVSLLGFKLASRPADLQHPYGHGRYEYLAGLVVAALIVVVGVELVHSSINKLVSPEPTEFSSAVVVVLVLSIAVKLWMASFSATVGKHIDSETLHASSIDSRNDAITTTVVLACAAISATSGIDLDGWAGCVVGCFIAYSGIGLLRDTINPLLGQAPAPELVEHIRTKILSYPGVLGTHDLMVHDYGPGRQFASAHVEMSADTSPLESHDLIDTIEQDFKDQDHLIVTLHYDPIVTDDPALCDLRNWLTHEVIKIDSRITVHDVRLVVGITHTNLVFDVVRPTDLALTPSELTCRISDLVHITHPNYICKIEVDESYVSASQ